MNLDLDDGDGSKTVQHDQCLWKGASCEVKTSILKDVWEKPMRLDVYFDIAGYERSLIENLKVPGEGS